MINDILQERKKINQVSLTGINYLVPNAICKLLTSGTILINLYWSKNHDVQLMGMGVATLFSFVFGYLLLISLNLGLAYEIGRRRNSPNNIGIYYQRALVINFIVCAFIITPILYISKKLMMLFVHIDENLAIIISEYLFQLAPSIYFFAFYDTTQTFLLAQGHFLAVLVINIFGFFCHLFLIEHLGAAWSRNLMDFGKYIAIYLHLALKPTKINSWIQWTIKCFKSWSTYLQFFKNIGLTTYIQSLYLFIFAAISYQLPRPQLICHICFINIVQIIFLVNIGLKQGLVIKLAYLIKENNIKNNTRSIALNSLKIFFMVSFFIIFLIFMYRTQICQFFLTNSQSKQIFMQKYWVLFIGIISNSLNQCLFTIIKIFHNDYSLLKFNLPFILFACIISCLLCYKLQLGLVGLWEGWILGSILNIVFNWIAIMKYQRIKYLQQKSKKQPILVAYNNNKQYQQDHF